LIYFRDQIKKILSTKKCSIQEATEYYIVTLLHALTHVDQESESRPVDCEIPLALLYAKACEADNVFEKYQHLKILGDHALFVSGLFGDSLKNQIVDIDYYIGMGSNAYQILTSISVNKEFSDIYGELSLKFDFMVDILSELSEEFHATSNHDLLRLYERWTYTKSDRLLRKLRNKGMDPLMVSGEKKCH